MTREEVLLGSDIPHISQDKDIFDSDDQSVYLYGYRTGDQIVVTRRHVGEIQHDECVACGLTKKDVRECKSSCIVYGSLVNKGRHVRKY